MSDVGAALMLKSFGAAVTVTETVVEWTAVPSVPVMVTVYVPAATLAPTLTVSVELPPAVTDAGLRLAVGPAGEMVFARLMVPAVPEVRAVPIVTLADAPATIVSDVGAALMLKSFGGTVVPQPGNLNEAIRVCQLNAPFDGMYSLVYQNVQSSVGSTAMAL